jgi:hypothetical protein
MSYLGLERGTDLIECFDVHSVQYDVPYYIINSTCEVYIQLQSHLLGVSAIHCYQQGVTPLLKT